MAWVLVPLIIPIGLLLFAFLETGDKNEWVH
jgi:hypothetical protein